MLVTLEDKLKLKYDRRIAVKHVRLSTGSFFAKYCEDERIFKELIAKKIVDVIGLNCPNYYLYEEEHCVVSEDLTAYGNYTSAQNLKMDAVTLSNIRNILEIQRDKYGKYINVEQLMFEVYIMHFFDTLFSNIDRHNGNFGFILNSDNTGRLVIFDNDRILEEYYKATRPVAFENANELDYVYHSKEQEFEAFLEQVPDSAKEVFLSIFTRLTPKMVKTIMKIVEKENNKKFPCKKELLKGYQKNYKNIGKVLLKSKIIK